MRHTNELHDLFSNLGNTRLKLELFLADNRSTLTEIQKKSLQEVLLGLEATIDFAEKASATDNSISI